MTGLDPALVACHDVYEKRLGALLAYRLAFVASPVFVGTVVTRT
jgi:hypothetical protein